MIDRKIMVIQIWVFGRYFPENEWSDTDTSSKQLTVSVASGKIQIFQKNLNLGKLEFATMSLTASQHLQILKKWPMVINKCGFLILSNEICPHLEVLHISVYFPNIVTRSCLVRDPFKEEDKPILNWIGKVHWHGFRFHTATNL